MKIYTREKKVIDIMMKSFCHFDFITTKNFFKILWWPLGEISYDKSLGTLFSSDSPKFIRAKKVVDMWLSSWRKKVRYFILKWLPKIYTREKSCWHVTFVMMETFFKILGVMTMKKLWLPSLSSDSQNLYARKKSWVTLTSIMTKKLFQNSWGHDFEKVIDFTMW